MYVLSTSTSCNRGEYFVRISLMPEKEKKRERKKVNYFSPVLSQTPILFYFKKKKKKRKDGKKNTWKYFNENSFKEGKRSKTKLRV